MPFPDKVKIVEVSPRDGLQNEAMFVETGIKIELVNRLSAAGFPNIEAASFVSPKWVPQMADAAAVMNAIKRRPGAIYSALTPNWRGFNDALAVGADEVECAADLTGVVAVGPALATGKRGLAASGPELTRT